MFETLTKMHTGLTHRPALFAADDGYPMIATALIEPIAQVSWNAKFSRYSIFNVEIIDHLNIVLACLIRISLASLLWDIGKQCITRSDAEKRRVG